jgi:signal transduction histidine kinase
LLTADERREPFGASDRRLIEPLVGPLAVAVNSLMLTRRMQRHLEDVVSAGEEVRRRVQRDIHDGTGLLLSAAALQLEGAHAKVATDPATARSLIDSVSRLQRQVVDDLHRLVIGLRPLELDAHGLLGALRAKAAEVGDAHRDGGGDALSIEIEGSDLPAELPAAVEVAAYRVACEAMNNVVRHADARTARVALWWADEALMLKVSDDGKGLPAQYRAGVGLTSMRERVAEIGGTWTVTPGAGGGTVILARFPRRVVPPQRKPRPDGRSVPDREPADGDPQA